jgi:NTP pyrophosphatase (non-canonical NTP hydrolase)
MKFLGMGGTSESDVILEVSATGDEARALASLLYKDVQIVPALRPEVQWFAQAMEKELRENDHKGGWSATSFTELIQRLHEESGELARAVDEFLRALVEQRMQDGTHVLAEAADVANFAMMIADIARRMYASQTGSAPP